MPEEGLVGEDAVLVLGLILVLAYIELCVGFVGSTYPTHRIDALVGISEVVGPLSGQGVWAPSTIRSWHGAQSKARCPNLGLVLSFSGRRTRSCRLDGRARGRTTCRTYILFLSYGRLNFFRLPTCTYLNTIILRPSNLVPVFDRLST